MNGYSSFVFSMEELPVISQFITKLRKRYTIFMFYFHSQPVLLKVLCRSNSCFFLVFVQSVVQFLFNSMNSSDMICRGVTGAPKKLLPSNEIVPFRLQNVISLPNKLIWQPGKKNWMHMQKPKAFEQTFEQTKEVFLKKCNKWDAFNKWCCTYVAL